jgi:hypothetical protein
MDARFLLGGYVYRGYEVEREQSFGGPDLREAVSARQMSLFRVLLVVSAEPRYSGSLGMRDAGV